MHPRSLLGHFWDNAGSPTTKSKCQYQKAIFCTSEEQLNAADASLKLHQSESSHKLYVKVSKAGPWFDAEEYHQKYYSKH